MTTEQMQALAQRIYRFLAIYAAIRGDYDPECHDDDEKYASPDASMLRHAADLLMIGQVPGRCWSEWGSGGYRPYASTEGRLEHELLIAELNKAMGVKDGHVKG